MVGRGGGGRALETLPPSNSTLRRRSEKRKVAFENSSKVISKLLLIIIKMAVFNFTLIILENICFIEKTPNWELSALCLLQPKAPNLVFFYKTYIFENNESNVKPCHLNNYYSNGSQNSAKTHSRLRNYFCHFSLRSMLGSPELIKGQISRNSAFLRKCDIIIETIIRRRPQ